MITEDMAMVCLPCGSRMAAAADAETMTMTFQCVRKSCGHRQELPLH